MGGALLSPGVTEALGYPMDPAGERMACARGCLCAAELGGQYYQDLGCAGWVCCGSAGQAVADGWGGSAGLHSGTKGGAGAARSGCGVGAVGLMFGAWGVAPGAPPGWGLGCRWGCVGATEAHNLCRADNTVCSYFVGQFLACLKRGGDAQAGRWRQRLPTKLQLHRCLRLYRAPELVTGCPS